MKNTVKVKCDCCGNEICEVRNDIKNSLGLASQKYFIIQCQKCKLVALYPQPTKEEIHDFYTYYGSKKNRLKDEEQRAENVYPNKLEKLKKYAKGSRLLDIGAGLGTFSFMAKEEGFEVTGIELSPEQCKVAKERYGIELLNIDVFENHNDIGKFDVIHLHHVVEHLTSPMKMLKTIEHLLNDDGIVLIEVPYQLKKIQDYVKAGKKKATEFDIDHLFFFSPNTMRNYIESISFELIEFNQHRPGKIKKKEGFSNPIKYAKYIFHQLTSDFFIPSGSFLEFYCRKTSKGK